MHSLKAAIAPALQHKKEKMLKWHGPSPITAIRSTWRVFRVVLILQSYLYQVRMPLILCYILRICSGENLVLQGSPFLEPTWGQSFAILFIFATLLLPTEICICIKNINKHNLLSIKFPIKKSFIHFSWLWVINKIFT